MSATLIAFSSDAGDTFQPELEIGWTLGGFPRTVLSDDGHILHCAWTTEDVPDRGLWYAQVDARARRVRKQRLQPDGGLAFVSARGGRVVIGGSAATVFVSADEGSTFGPPADIDPPLGNLDPYLSRIGLWTRVAHADGKMVTVVSTKGTNGPVFFSASHDGGGTFSRAENLWRSLPTARRTSFEPAVHAVGRALVVTWAELDAAGGEAYLAFAGRTTKAVRLRPSGACRSEHAGASRRQWCA
jgi:hypothetical protein